MGVLKGKVVTFGKRDFGSLPVEWQTYYNEKTEMELVKGSLNIDLGNEISFKNPTFDKYKFAGTPDGRYVYLIPCVVSMNDFKRGAYLQRIENVENNDPDYHPRNIIEILSDVNFCEKWSLKNDDEITVELVNQ